MGRCYLRCRTISRASIQNKTGSRQRCENAQSPLDHLSSADSMVAELLLVMLL